MPPRSRLAALLACIRYDEVFLLQGSPLVGVVFSIRPVTIEKLVTCAVFCGASFLLVAHIFTFNDWAAAEYDRNDPNRSKTVFQNKGVTGRHLFLFSIFLVAASLVVFTSLQPRLAVLGAAIAALGILYSNTRLSAKATPILSSTAHFVGGLLHFLLGYGVFSVLDERGLLIAIFFALTFSAGHLNHEVRDSESDERSKLRTNAVVFGKRPAFLAGLAIFTVAYAYLFFLAWCEVVPRPLVILPIVLFPLHLFWSVRTLRNGLTFKNVSRLKARYRLLYLIIGVSMVVALFYP